MWQVYCRSRSGDCAASTLLKSTAVARSGRGTIRGPRAPRARLDGRRSERAATSNEGVPPILEREHSPAMDASRLAQESAPRLATPGRLSWRNSRPQNAECGSSLKQLPGPSEAGAQVAVQALRVGPALIWSAPEAYRHGFQSPLWPLGYHSGSSKPPYSRTMYSRVKRSTGRQCSRMTIVGVGGLQ